ncbi:MAG: DUF1295 domain-containing protein [Candidatus Omnitrophica bacterium]|nr:DUF1295 domain-containing protein [Candidatus Omnitrophota bacterium]MCB9721034.1 DUF1295 domain-containing protein [Candidatus Omnitrophota bacterium]
MLTAYLTGCVTVAVMMALIWVIHLRKDDATIVDMGWGFGFVMMSAIFIVCGAGWTQRNILLWVLLLLWGARIIVFIAKRMRQEGHEDKRYAMFRLKWAERARLNFLKLFECQALLQMIVVLPVLCVAFNPRTGLNWWEVTAAVIFVIGLVGESVADEQLRTFQNDAGNRGKVCRTGLWAYSRHPNYFFEIVIWTAVYLYALASPGGWLTVVSPLTIVFIILKITGIPLAEQQSLKSRGEEYRRYQETTSVLIPLPQKRTRP